jgi:hypothetical protein
MAGYVTLPATFTEATAKHWIALSVDYVSGLPPRQQKVSKTKSGR